MGWQLKKFLWVESWNSGIWCRFPHFLCCIIALKRLSLLVQLILQVTLRHNYLPRKFELPLETKQTNLIHYAEEHNCSKSRFFWRFGSVSSIWYKRVQLLSEQVITKQQEVHSFTATFIQILAQKCMQSSFFFNFKANSRHTNRSSLENRLTSKLYIFCFEATAYRREREAAQRANEESLVQQEQ